jgi:K+-transporting ATPase KdpF subunit
MDGLALGLALAFLCGLLSHAQLVGETEEFIKMDWLYLISGIVVLVLFVYLGVALFNPEAFS